MEVARRFTRRLHELPSEELELIAGLFVRREVHKGELLISEKDIARDIVFVEKGLLRQFYFKEGRDITENFACDGDGAMCIVSLFTGRRNCLQLESLEEGVIWSISYAGLVELSERYLHIARLLRHLLEGSLMLSQYKADSWRFETSRERYARFVRGLSGDSPACLSQPHSILSVNDSRVSEPGTCRSTVTVERLFYTAFPSFSKSLRDLLCVTMYTPRNTKAMAIPFSKLNTPNPKMMATVEATMGCM